MGIGGRQYAWKVNQRAPMVALFVFRLNEFRRRRSMKMQLLGRVAGMTTLLALCGSVAGGQEPSVPNASQPAAAREAPKDQEPVALTLKSAIELALQNSKEIQVAKIQASVADRAAQITKAQFMPNLYAGSGAGD